MIAEALRDVSAWDRKSIWCLIWAVRLWSLGLLIAAACISAPLPQDAQVIERTLKEIAAGKGELAPLVVTYDDLHPLHGGLRLTIRGDGAVEQTAPRTNAGRPRAKVGREDLVRLVALLVEHETWTQRARDRAPEPDESRAQLSIAYRDREVRIRERRDELEKTARISKVRDLMTEMAWEKPWTLEITTSGGFVNQGAGNVKLTSQGYVRARRSFSSSPPCTATLSLPQTQSLDEAVRSAQPDEWRASSDADGDKGCCDRYRYTLALEIQGADGRLRRYATYWHDGTELPPRLATLFRLAWDIKRKVQSCK